jgi:hypothetical protein
MAVKMAEESHRFLFFAMTEFRKLEGESNDILASLVDNNNILLLKDVRSTEDIET